MLKIKKFYHLKFHQFLKKNRKVLENRHNKEFKKNYNNYISQFKNSLNKFHNLNFSNKQWEIIIGPWLLYSFNIFFFYSNFFLKNVKINLNLKNTFINIPFDFNNYFNLISSYKFFEIFNKLTNGKINTIRYEKIIKIKSYKLKFYLNTIFRYISHFRETILINKLKLKKISLFKLVLSSCFKFIPVFTHNLCFYNCINQRCDERNFFFFELEQKIPNQKKFIKFLKYTMPASYIENFKKIEIYARQNLPKSKVILSESSYINDDLFKINCALNKMNKINLLQHGGNMRSYKKNLCDFHENKIANKILVWGLKRRSAKELFLPATRLKKFKNEINNIVNRNIKYKYCFVLEPLRIFSINFFKFNSPLRDLLNIFSFLKKNKKNIIKLHYDNSGSNILNINQIINLLKIPKKYLTLDFNKVLESEFVILNYFSTMLFELININKPVFLIIDINEHFFSKFGKQLFFKLKKNNLLFHNINDFQKFSKNINLYEWWNNRKNQKFIYQFKKAYCNIDSAITLKDLIKKIC